MPDGLVLAAIGTRQTTPCPRSLRALLEGKALSILIIIIIITITLISIIISYYYSILIIIIVIRELRGFEHMST